MMRFCATDAEPVVEDVLVNVPGNGTFEIIDYSVGGNNLYFTGLTLSGKVVGGRVDLDTFSFTPFSESYRLTSIEVY